MEESVEKSDKGMCCLTFGEETYVFGKKTLSTTTIKPS
jgi:hypothetical protein